MLYAHSRGPQPPGLVKQTSGSLGEDSLFSDVLVWLFLLWRFALSFSEIVDDLLFDDDCCPWLFFWLDVILCLLDIAWWGFECWLPEFSDFRCWCCYLKKHTCAAFVHTIQRTEKKSVFWDILGYSSLRVWEHLGSWVYYSLLLKLRIISNLSENKTCTRKQLPGSNPKVFLWELHHRRSLDPLIATPSETPITP